MRANRNVVDPHLDWNEMTPSVRLVIDQERARALGLTPQDVSQTLQTLLSGVTVTIVRDGTEQVEVVARAVAAERLDLGRVGDLTIVSRNGIAVPLAQVGAPRIRARGADPVAAQPRHVDHRARRRRRRRAAAGRDEPDLADTCRPMRDSLEPGYRLEIGGAVEESEKGNASIFALFPLMIVGDADAS